MSDLLTEIQTVEKECQPLYQRMDADADLIAVTDRVLKDASEKPAKIPNSVFVPLNDLMVFVTTVESYLYEAIEQVEVTSEDENLDTASIEALIKAIWRNVDDKWTSGIYTGGKQFPLAPFLYQQTTRRGRITLPCCFRIENGELITDIRAWDSRFVTYRIDDKGLVWKSYLTTRSIRDIKTDYPKVKLPDGKELVEVRNVWTRKENKLYVGNQEAFTLPHDYGYVPGVVQVVPIGTMTMDADSTAYEGESILLMVRDVFPHLCNLASIAQTLNMKELDHAIQENVPKEAMNAEPPPEHDQITDPRAVTKTPGVFAAMPLGELRQQARDLAEMLERRMQRGGLSNFDMGTFNQSMSAVALIRVGQGRDKVYSPRLGTFGLAKKALTKMAIKQIGQEAKKKGIRSVKIGEQTYDISILKSEYDIDFKYKISDATVDIAKQQMAVQQKGMIPRISILRDTLGRDDPDGDLRELYSEEAELLFPNIKRMRILKALAEKAEKGDDDAQLELELGLAELGITIDQLFNGQLPPVNPPEEPKPAQPMVDLFDDRANAGRVNTAI